jgi:hypothetical protein
MTLLQHAGVLEITALELSSKRLVIVGYPEVNHIGSRLLLAAEQLGLDVRLCDANQAAGSSRFLQRINWRLRGHRPTHLTSFGNEVVETCREFAPDTLLVTGITPPNAEALQIIRQMGIRCINYLTDDPWNRVHWAPWFFKALPLYSVVFSPRRANINDLLAIVPQVEYLPFAYDPALQYLEAPPPELRPKMECDVLFYGGADRDRIPYIEALIDAGTNVHLYGGYWQKFPKTAAAWQGMADYQTLRWAVSAARLTLCLVRRANRDGHVMRSFEAPAMGACMLAEATEEHHEIFGAEGEAVAYFRTKEDLVSQAQALVKNESLREIFARNAHKRITQAPNTYQDRLRTMLSMV